MLTFHKASGIYHRPAFHERLGQRIKARDLEPKFFECLEQVRDKRPDLIPESVQISEEYGIYRSFCRGSTPTIVNQCLYKDIIDANNKWQKFEQAGASKLTQTMKDHYADIKLMLKHLLR